MRKKSAPSCDWDSPRGGGKKRSDAGKKPPASRARVMRHRADFSWSGVATRRYKLEDGTWAGVLRRTLVGEKGEGTKFHLRYFEVAPGGHTTLERHRHEHVVVCIRGRGRCRVRGRSHDLGFLDTIYIPPEALHRLSNPFGEPFGFFCLVDAERDRPRPAGR
jgi:ribulose-bisphosphate carboxylase large chain